MTTAEYITILIYGLIALILIGGLILLFKWAIDTFIR